MSKTAVLPKKLLAQPDGKIHWSATMEKEIQNFMRRHGQEWNEKMKPEQGFGRNYEMVMSVYGWRYSLGAYLQLLRWHGEESDSTFVPQLLAGIWQALGTKDYVNTAACIHREEAIGLLFARIENLDFRKTVAKLAALWPLYILKKLLDLDPAGGQPAGILVLELLAAKPGWAEPLAAQCSEAQLKTLTRLTRTEKVAEAAMEELPAFIRNPPWRQGRTFPEIPVLILEPPRDELTIHWSHEDRLWVDGDPVEAFCRDYANELGAVPPPGCDDRSWAIAYTALFLSGVKRESIEGLLAGGTACADDFCVPPRSWRGLPPVLALPENLAEPVLRYGTLYFIDNYSSCYLRLLKHFGAKAIDWVARAIQREKYCKLSESILKVEAPALAPVIAHVFCSNKWAKPLARQWLLHYPAAAARGLIPAAFGPAAPFREAARTVLRWLAGQGSEAILAREASGFGYAAAEALALLLAMPPEGCLPEKLPVLNAKIYQPGLPRLYLRADGRAIPLAAMPDVLMNLMLSKADEPYPGLASLQEAVTPDSLARLGWALVDWWQKDGTPPKERWIFLVQGLIGDDETARQLNRALLQWRGDLIRQRAYEAMAMLAQIGSDVAIMFLHGLSQQTRYNDLRERASALVRQVADGRGLSVEQLADRTVPDLGLGADGKLVLDFGPRQFTVTFDENLAPGVRDNDGNPLKDLPKPNAKDDAPRAKAAVARYKELKKQVNSIAAAQVKRLEAAMVDRRRWSPSEFTDLFVAHPLLGHLVRRLVWGVFNAEGKLIGACRVAEDLSLADAEDRACRLPDAARVGIAHPLELPAGMLVSFGQLFADYRIIQPFPQLAREIYRLRPEDREAAILPEWEDRKITIGSLMGLEKRGWRRQVGEGGLVNAFTKILAGRELRMDLEGEWFVAGMADVKEVMTIRRLGLIDGGHWDGVDAVDFSEMQRDLHLMAWFKD